MSTQYELRKYGTGKLLSKHPNLSGCKLSSLFHVPNGTKIYWDEEGPVQGMRGHVSGSPRFYIEPVER